MVGTVPQSAAISSLRPKKPISSALAFNDHSKNKEDSDSDGGQSVARGGVVTPFRESTMHDMHALHIRFHHPCFANATLSRYSIAWKVHDMLEKSDVDGIDHIVSWLPHGRAFMVHRPQEFVDQVMVSSGCFLNECACSAKH